HAYRPGGLARRAALARRRRGGRRHVHRVGGMVFAGGPGRVHDVAARCGARGRSRDRLPPGPLGAAGGLPPAGRLRIPGWRAGRGPAQGIIARFGPRLGLTEARLRRAAAFAEARGRPGLALGRGTPGLRTLTVIAAGVSGLNGRRALPALIVGSSVFLQFHLVLGLLLGPLADRAFDRAKGLALAVAVVLVAAGVLFWRARRRKRAAAPTAWMEPSCPACIGVSLLAGRVPSLA